MGWIKCVCCEKLQRDFGARTFVLIAPVQYVLHQVSCSYETIPIAPKYCETLVSGPMGWMGCIGCDKITMRLRGMNFCINCTSSPRFAPTFMQSRNDPKCTHTLWNTPKHEFRVQWDGSGAFVANFCINCTSSVCFASSFMQLRNDPKCTKILWNRPKH